MANRIAEGIAFFSVIILIKLAILNEVFTFENIVICIIGLLCAKEITNDLTNKNK